MKRAGIWLALLLALSYLALAQEQAAPAAEHTSAESVSGEHGAKGEGHGGAAHEPDLTNWKWVNFAILAAGLGYLVVKQALPYFAARSAEIRNGIEDARKLRAEAEARAAAMEARLADLGAEVESMRQAAREEAAQESARMRQESEREQAKIQSHAGQEIASALKTARVELRTYSAELAVELARKKIEERITPADQERLFQGFVSDLAGKLEPGATQ